MLTVTFKNIDYQVVIFDFDNGYNIDFDVENVYLKKNGKELFITGSKKHQKFLESLKQCIIED